MSPDVAYKVIRLFRRTGPPPRIDASLTERERELLGLLAEGHSYQAAGEAMGITVNTVRNHVRSIYDKLHVHSRSEAVSKAIRAGLV
jgi:DNA-binding NarL/FixJ family response regulator